MSRPPIPRKPSLETNTPDTAETVRQAVERFADAWFAAVSTCTWKPPPRPWKDRGLWCK
jgi:hypothetical protein